MATIKLKRAATAGASLTYGEMAIGGNELYFGNSSNSPVKMSKDGHTHSIANVSGLQTALNAKLSVGADLPEANLVWGGKNLVSTYGPIDAAMVSELGANRLAFMPAPAVNIEYSRDGGSTWVDYDATEQEKIDIFNGVGTVLTIGKNTSPSVSAENYQLRVTLNILPGTLYTTLNKFVMLVSTRGSTGNWVTIDGRLQSNVTANINTWTTFSNKALISGWSGYNVINTSGITTYGNTATSQYGQVRFTFGCTGYTPQGVYGLEIQKILGFGGVGWTTPSTLAKFGRMYNYDWLQNVQFPKEVYNNGSYSSNNILTNRSWVSSNTRSNTWVPSWSEITSKPDVIIEGDSRLTNARPASSIDTSILGSTTPSATKFLAGDRVWKRIAFSVITDTPDTLSGYGITDAAPLSHASSTSNPHNVTAAQVSAMSTSHAANAITSTNISNWNMAHGWGNHASAGYIKAHPTITMGTNTTTTSSPGYAGTFTAIDSITKDSNGHVTKINTKTVTMPSAQSIPSIPSVMDTTEGNKGTATTQRTINAKNLKAIILNHSPAGARTPTAHEHMSIEIRVGQDAGSSKLSVFQDIDGSGYTTKTGLALFRQYGSSQPMLEISKPYASNSSIEFITDEGNAFNFNKPVKVNNTNVSLAGHTHTKSEITDFAHTHTKSQITDFAHNHNDLYYTETEVNNLLAAKAEPWKLIRDTQIGIPTSFTAGNVAVVSGNYYGKILAFEVRVATNADTYETHIVFARMGTNNTTSTSATFDRFYSWTTFDGRYFKTHSFKAYCSNATSTTITVGALKHLIGSFLNNTIEWTTPQITTYLERIWLVN